MPAEYIEYKLMREVYHCTPLEFDKQPSDIIDLHLEFISIDSQRKELEDQRRQQENRIKSKMKRKK